MRQLFAQSGNPGELGEELVQIELPQHAHLSYEDQEGLSEADHYH